MRVRAGLLMILAIGALSSLSGCAVAESMVLTTHMRHGTTLAPDFDPSEIRAKQPKGRTPVDVPAEAPPTVTP